MNASIVSYFFVAVICCVAGVVIALRLRPKFPRDTDNVSWDHFWSNLDKFLAVFLFLVCTAITVHMLHHGADSTALSWIQGVVSQLLSALLALMGARAWSNRGNGNGNGNGSGPSPQLPNSPTADPNGTQK